MSTTEREDVSAILAQHNFNPANADSVFDAVEDDACFDALFKYYYFDRHAMPYGTAKARTGDPFQWMHDRLAGVL